MHSDINKKQITKNNRENLWWPGPEFFLLIHNRRRRKKKKTQTCVFGGINKAGRISFHLSKVEEGKKRLVSSAMLLWFQLWDSTMRWWLRACFIYFSAPPPQSLFFLPLLNSHHSDAESHSTKSVDRNLSFSQEMALNTASISGKKGAGYGWCLQR